MARVQTGLAEAPSRAAIAGCGRIAGAEDGPRDAGPVLSHAQAFHRHAGFRLEAVCEPDPLRLRAFSDTWRVPASYASLGELLSAERPRVLSICAGTDQHVSLLQEALSHDEGPRVIFVEKPVCTRPEEWTALAASAAAGSALVVVNHTRRFDPAYGRVKALVEQGALGALVRGRCYYYGGWMNNGCHLVDTLRMWLGDLTIEDARASRVAETRPGDPCVDVVVRSGGATIDVHAVDERIYEVFDIDLLFERGRVTATQCGERIVVQRATAERVLAPDADMPWTALSCALLHAVDAIASHLRGGDALLKSGTTLAEAGRTMSLLWEARARA